MQSEPRQMTLKLNDSGEVAIPVQHQRALIETLSELLLRAASQDDVRTADEAHDDHEDR